MFNNWLKIAFVTYKKNALSTLVNLLGLTLGITSFILIVLQWVDEENYENWNPNKQRIYLSQMFFPNENGYWNTISYPMAFEASKRIEGIEDFILINNYFTPLKVTHNSKSFFSENNFKVSDNYFKYFPYELKYGSYSKIFKNKNDIAISTKVSEALFGATNPIGKSLKLEFGTYYIKAVYKLPDTNTEFDPTCVFYCKDIDENKDNWGNFNFNGYFILKPNAAPEQIQNEIFNKVLLLRAKEDPSISPMEYIKLYGPSKALLTRLDQMKLYAENNPYGQSKLKLIVILFSLSILLLVLSAINFINLKTAEATQRAKEVGVRKVLGANPVDIIKQFLIETALIGVFATFLALVIVELILPYFNLFFKKDINQIPPIIFGYALLILFSIVLLSGIVPAIYVSNFKPVATLKGNFSRSKKGIFLRNFILGLQLVISSFFIIGGLIVNKQVNYMMDKDLGFKGDQIYVIRFQKTEGKAWLKYERAKSELLKLKGVQAVSFGEATPNGGQTGSSNVDYGKKSVQSIHGAMDYDFLSFMGVKLKTGRLFSPQFASDTIDAFIVNESFVQKMGWTNTEALGKKVKPGFEDKKFKIVGVVADYNIFGVQHMNYPIVFFHYKSADWKKESIWNIQIKISKEDLEGTRERIQHFWESKMEPDYPLDGYFLDKRFAMTFVEFEKQRLLFAILNFLVLVVALLGLFALSSLLIEQKLKEVAIRKTLGASERDLVVGLTKNFVTITIVAVLLSFPIAYFFMDQWLQDFAYRIRMPWIPFLISMFMLIALTVLVVSIKAYRATQINMINYLKYE